jgi:hypothetical protein
MIELDPCNEEPKFSKRLARLLRPELDEVLGFKGIDLLDLSISGIDLDDLTLMSNGEEIRIEIIGRTMGCRA